MRAFFLYTCEKPPYRSIIFSAFHWTYWKTFLVGLRSSLPYRYTLQQRKLQNREYRLQFNFPVANFVTERKKATSRFASTTRASSSNSRIKVRYSRGQRYILVYELIKTPAHTTRRCCSLFFRSLSGRVWDNRSAKIPNFEMSNCLRYFKQHVLTSNFPTFRAAPIAINLWMINSYRICIRRRTVAVFWTTTRIQLRSIPPTHTMSSSALVSCIANTPTAINLFSPIIANMFILFQLLRFNSLKGITPLVRIIAFYLARFLIFRKAKRPVQLSLRY